MNDNHDTGNTNDSREQKAVSLILRETDDRDKRALLSWLDELLTIRNSGQKKREKLRRIFASFRHVSNLLPLLRALKSVLWDDRSTSFRLGVGLTAAAAMLVPGQVGIAGAFGAVAIPLWIVFGAGASFAVMLASELRKSLSRVRDGEIIEADYEVIKTENER